MERDRKGNMKKAAFSIVLVFLASALVLACGGKAAPSTTTATTTTTKASSTTASSTTTTKPATTTSTSAAPSSTATAVKYPLADWPKQIVVPYQGTGGQSQAVVLMFGSMVQKYLKVPVTPIETRGTSEVFPMLYKGEVDMGFSVPPAVFGDAVRGRGDYAKDGKLKQLIFMSNEGFAAFNAVTWEGSGVNSGADLKGKRVMYKNPGSAVSEQLGEIFLDGYGIKPADVKALTYTSYQEIWTALKDRTIDAALFIRNPPNAELQELSKNTKLKWISLSPEAEARINTTQPWIATGKKGNVIRANTYTGQTTDISILGYTSIRHLRSDLPASFVYQLLNLMYGEYRSEYTKAHASTLQGDIKLEPLHIGVAPYHPGAIQFYKDKGVWTKEHDDLNNKVVQEIAALK